MKQTILSSLLLVIATIAFSQQTQPSLTLIQQDYLDKSNIQKTAAWVLLGGGAALIITGSVIPQGELEFNPLTFSNDHKNDGVKAVFYLGGTLAMLGSIPLFIASKRNKRKAINVAAYLKFEKTPFVQQARIDFHSFPAVSIKING